ncbi:MAG: hypothetical protein JWP03_3479 [Phycisphaerales bacterium]|nr:hypothetical protein [Phycisphaerales bacterium]
MRVVGQFKKSAGYHRSAYSQSCDTRRTKLTHYQNVLHFFGIRTLRGGRNSFHSSRNSGRRPVSHTGNERTGTKGRAALTV